jgi:ceramide glucosyltransferase
VWDLGPGCCARTTNWLYAIVRYITLPCCDKADLYLRFRYYSSKPTPAACIKLPTEDIPHVTILRPAKGLEPQLYECLAATFHQTYPREKLAIYFCVSSSSDPAYPVLRRLISDFPDFDAKLFIEEEDPNLSGHGGDAGNLGPNPKIRNLSRGYREAKGDIVWILDCNVWVGKGVAGRMVDKLCGYGPAGVRVMPYKFVHQLPLVVDSVGASAAEEARGLLEARHDDDRAEGTAGYDISSDSNRESEHTKALRIGGGRLEEMFMASSHAKFYTAINTVGIAPCIVGKSNMFRRSHLDYLTSTSQSTPRGIDFFSSNICEDHLIGDLLWRKKVPEEEAGEKWGKHHLVFGDLAIQPMARMSVRDYVARRVRWLRVRKWTVTMATLVEPGVECFLCSAYAAFALTTLPWAHTALGIPHTWATSALIWLLLVIAWIAVDRLVFAKLHSCASVELDPDTPSFARPPTSRSRRSAKEWLAAWLSREILALPIWTYAVLGGTTVVWRSKKFWVGMDMKVYEIKGKERSSPSTPRVENGHAHRNKDRRD